MESDSRLQELVSRWHDLHQQGQAPAPEELCADCPELAGELRRRLRAVASLEGFLGVKDGGLPSTLPIAGGTAPTGDHPDGPGPAPSAPPGYEVLGELGRGGMGVVYLARQVHLDRVVALKMILAGGHAGAEELARFRAEAQAVARLHHPHIVQIHEVGEHEGRPYFCLEYCPSGSLDHKLAGTPLPPPEAAALVEALARAMHAAHSRGVVHRDLKPANVLLAEGGMAKVGDFGLAKRLDQAGQTATGDIVGTPSYMAPEQARGLSKAAGPAADIYALGVILYECLAGRPPFKAASAMETLLLVLEAEPVAVRQLQPAVPRDLETVCLKCLQKEPARRYGTAEELAEDLRRFRAGEPIRARPVRTVERTWRWCRRNPAGAGLLAALAVAVLTVGVAAVLVGYKNLELSASREREHRAAEQARRTIEDMTSEEALSFLETQKELRPEQRRFLEKALAFYHEAAEGQPPGEEGQARQAKAYLQMGKVQQAMGMQAEAETAYRTALEGYQRLATEHPRVQQYHLELAGSHNVLGSLLLDLGKRSDVEAECRAALQELQRLGEEDSPGAQYHQELGRSHITLGNLMDDQGKREEAEKAYRAALKERQFLVEEYPLVPQYRQDLARSYHNLGNLLDDLGKRSESEAAYRAALKERQRLVEEHPEMPQYRHDLAVSHLALGDLLGDEASYRTAQKELQRLVEEYPLAPLYRHRLAMIYYKLGILLAGGDKGPEAEEAYRAALKELQRLAEEHPRVPEYRRDLARSYHNMGNMLTNQEKWEAAEAAFRAAIKELKRLVEEDSEVPPYRKELAYGHHGLGLALAGQGEFPKAEGELQTAVQLLQRLVVEQPQETGHVIHLAETYRCLGDVVLDGRQPAQALEWFDQAIPALEEALRQVKTPGASSYLRDIRLERTIARAHLGQAAVAEVEQLLKADPAEAFAPEADSYYAAARVFARAAGQATDTALAERYAGRAVELLGRAVAKDYQDGPRLRKEKDLDALRQRDDFQKLLREVQKKK